MRIMLPPKRLALALSLLLLAACGADTPAPAESILEMELDADLRALSAEPVTVHLPVSTDQHLSYAAQLAQDAGFNLAFKRYATEGDALESGLHGQNIYVTSQYRANALRDAGRIGDFAAQLAQAAPDYGGYLLHAVRGNTPGGVYFMRLDRDIEPWRPTALVRNEAARAYGAPILGMSDYTAFLRWQKAREPRYTPGLYAAYEEDLYFGGMMGISVFNCFLPEMGYASLAGLFSQDFEVNNYLWMDKATGRVDALYHMSEAVDALIQLAELKNEGLLDFWAADGVSMKSIHATFLIEPSWGLSLLLGDIANTANYTLVQFTEPAIERVGPASVAVAPPGADITVFLAFMEWLGDDIAHYRHFVYGEEGVDYATTDGRVTQRLSNYLRWEGRGLFWNGAFDPAFYQTDYNTGYAPSWTADSPPPPLLTRQAAPFAPKDIFEMGQALAEDGAYQEAAATADRIMRTMWTVLHDNYLLRDDYIDLDAAAGYRATVEAALDEIRQVPGIDRALDLVREYAE